MKCPVCQTINRDDRERCYTCQANLAPLRATIAQARLHFNNAIEHAERGRNDEAIKELLSSVALDRSFAPAHVVLGTLHARNGDTARAAASWNDALALNPDLNKAHGYLQKLDTVNETMPALTRLQATVRFLLLVSALLTVTVLVMVFLQRPRTDLAESIALYQRGRTGQALLRIEQTLAALPPKSDLAQGLQALRGAIKSDLQQRIRAIQTLKYQDQYPAAIAAIAEVERLEPDEETSAALAILREDVSVYYRNQVESLYDDFAQDKLTLADLNGRVRAFLQLYPDAQSRRELQQYLDKARELEVERRTNRVLAQFREQHDVLATVADLDQLGREFPGSDALKVGRRVIIEEAVTWLIEEVVRLIGERDYNGARAMLQTVTNLADEFSDIVDVRGGVETATMLLQQTERTDRIQSIERLLNNKQFALAEVALDNLSANDNLTTAEAGLLSRFSDRLVANRISTEVASLRAQQARIFGLQANDATYRNIESLNSIVPAYRKMLNDADIRDLYAYAAASARKRGDSAAVAQRIERLRDAGADTTLIQQAQGTGRRTRRP